MKILRNKTTPAFLISAIILPIIFSTPANADDLTPEELKTQIAIAKEVENLQQIATSQQTIESQKINIESFEEIVEPPPPPPVQTYSPKYSGQAALSGYSNLLDAARAQLGVRQDCTAMVENALRAIGIGVGDLAPMGFASYGTKISPDQAQPGDIMMRGGHVAIYAGNGVAIHGGFNGNTVESTVDANPYNYSVIVRI